MRDPPMICDIPQALMITGSSTIIMIVNMMDMDTVMERSFFLAFDAAAVAIAALVPQTLVAVAMVMTSGLLPILSTLVPNHHMNRITIGVTIQAIPRP